MALTRTAVGLALVVVGFSAAGCAAQADGPPSIVLDRDACSHCGMLISEARHAAAFRAADGSTRIFDDIGCLRDAAGGSTAGLRVWVHDASDESWMEGGEATFVASPEIRTPMAGRMLAFRRASDAERAAEKYHGRVVRSVTSLLSTRRKESGS